MNKKTVTLIMFWVFSVVTRVDASPNKEIDNLDVVVYENGIPSIRRWTYKDIIQNKSFDIISPSPTNEREKKQTWSGRLIRDFIPEKLRNSKSLSDSLVLTSNDFYVSSPHPDMVLNHDAIVATKIDGVKIPWSNGGSQVMLPFGRHELPIEYRKHAWCPWFLTNIIIGEGSPILSIYNRNYFQENLDLRDKCKEKSSWKISYPRGQWHEPPKKRSLADVSRCSVSHLFSSKKYSNKNITFYSLNGSSIKMKSTSNKHYLAFAWDGLRIPSRFGGPVQLCFEGDHTDCQFFVHKVEVGE